MTNMLVRPIHNSSSWKYILLTLITVLLANKSYAQFVYGNTGLMHLPTAEMQNDKTVMMGWSWLDTKATPDFHDYGWDREPTMNYYLDVTILPWLDISYACTLIKGVYLAEWRGLDPGVFRTWANQDRHFDFRARLWKESWLKWWTPQVVVGVNDVLHTFSQVGTSGNIGISDEGNGFWGRFYVALTKHFKINGVGVLGAHIAYVNNNRPDFYYNGLGMGADFCFNHIESGSRVANYIIHGIRVMAEYDTRSFNIGTMYNAPILRDENGNQRVSLNAMFELNQAKFFSGSLCLKVCLK